MATRRTVPRLLLAVLVSTAALAACRSSTVTTSGTGSTAETTLESEPFTTSGPSSDFSIEPEVTCTGAHEQQVTWTLTNYGNEVEVVSASVDGDLQATPVFSPTTVLQGGSTTASVTLPGTFEGELDLHLSLSGGPQVETGGTTRFTGGC